MFLTFTMASVFSGAAVAQYSGPSDTGSPSGGDYPASTISAIITDPKDEAKVTIEGNLVRKIRDETYVFSDGTGEIEVEIDDEDFPAQMVDATTKVRVQGEVDTHLIKDTDINADRVTVID